MYVTTINTEAVYRQSKIQFTNDALFNQKGTSGNIMLTMNQ